MYKLSEKDIILAAGVPVRPAFLLPFCFPVLSGICKEAVDGQKRLSISFLLSRPVDLVMNLVWNQ